MQVEGDGIQPLLSRRGRPQQLQAPGEAAEAAGQGKTKNPRAHHHLHQGETRRTAAPNRGAGSVVVPVGAHGAFWNHGHYSPFKWLVIRVRWTLSASIWPC